MLNQKPIRALLLYEMFVSCGCYRPHAGEIFGPTVLRVAQAVLANEYLIVLPPIVNDEDETSDEVGDAEIVEAALDLEQIVTWVDVEKSLLVLELWDDKAGRDECFVGTMKTYLPLHYKEQRDNLTEVWGNYQLICQKTVIGQDPEYVSRLALNDPRNAPKLQMAWRYQPLDDIRDYFGGARNLQRAPRACLAHRHMAFWLPPQARKLRSTSRGYSCTLRRSSTPRYSA